MPTVIIYLNRRYIYISALFTENPSNKFMWTKILQLQFDDMNECINIREEICNDLIDLECISFPKDTRNLSFFFIKNMLILQDYFRNKFNVYDIDRMLDELSDDGDGDILSDGYDGCDYDDNGYDNVIDDYYDIISDYEILSDNISSDNSYDNVIDDYDYDVNE